MKDVLGQELTVGDSVFYSVTGYNKLAQGVIKKINSKTVAIELKKSWGMDHINKFPEGIVKIPKPHKDTDKTITIDPELEVVVNKTYYNYLSGRVDALEVQLQGMRIAQRPVVNINESEIIEVSACG